jgi:hypothetical protein
MRIPREVHLHQKGVYIYTFSHGVYDVPGIYVTCMILLEYDGTHTHIYIYMYVYVYICVCVCICMCVCSLNMRIMFPRI